MIRAIQSIEAFGIFDDFRWSSGLPEFKRFNLIYGWNYSGKTTLSRAFRCFEQKQRHIDFPDAEVQLKAADGTTYDLSNPQTAPPIRVFNTDFIRENLAFANGSANPILVLGAQDIAKQQALKEKQEERGKLPLDMGSAHRRMAEKRTAIDAGLTNYARDLIKNPLSKPNYNKTNFEPVVDKCRTAPDDFLLDDAALRECLSVYLATERKPTLSGSARAISPVPPAEKKVAEVLRRVVTASNPIPRLKENPAVESWVNEGRSLHAGATACQFCGQPLPRDLLTDLAEHFSADYENLMTEIGSLVRTLQSMHGEEVALPSKGEFYKELQGRFADEEKKLLGLIRARRSSLAALGEALVQKQTKAFTSLKCPEIEDPDAAIASAIQDIEKTISEHNARTAQFEKKRQEAFVRLERHYAASFVRDQKYNEELRQIAALKVTAQQLGERLGELEDDIRALERDLSEAAKGAERINELLLTYFGTNDLRIRVSADKRFEIVRSGAVAKNLSEGEKTAIAFAYFVTLVQDGRHPLADMIVVVDDPISSLDANHLFNTYALIKTQFSQCRQLFIATHSFELYSLIRDWAADCEDKNTKKPQQDWKYWSVYYVKRTDDGEAALEEIPKELLRFKSEYHYLFSILYRFDKAGEGAFDHLLSLPNVARRFMEAFGGIMIPRWAGLRGKMAELFPDKIECERVWKFINYYSHNTTVTRSLKVPDLSECRAVVHACLESVRKWDPDYFKILEDEVTQ